MRWAFLYAGYFWNIYGKNRGVDVKKENGNDVFQQLAIGGNIWPLYEQLSNFLHLLLATSWSKLRIVIFA